LFIRRFKNYNAPQVELVLATAAALGRPVHVVDVGAAVGDTALLLLDRCREVIDRLDCIEGDRDFFDVLVHNLPDPQVRVHNDVLADVPRDVRSLVRSQHSGTASAEGGYHVQATTLDALLAGARPDVIKIDTDGYDGRILAGSRNTLHSARPSVLFEWHPLMCRRLGTDEMQAFTELESQGYDRFLFFTKFGQFSHFGAEHLEVLCDLCLNSTTLPDWHYDVVALHASSPLDQLALADLRYWGSSGW
jgi:FkbM family methyltransferase